MKISLSDTGKRYNREWIFRHLSFTFESGTHYAITGSNGSGKSTLLQVLAGSLTHSEGTVHYERNGQTVAPDRVFAHISLVAPYLELPEEMSLEEFLQFHFQFKPLLPGLSTTEIVETVGLQQALHKQIRYYSSGMKQRVRLAQAIFANTTALFLDEPCTNLDAEGIALYHSLVDRYCRNRLVVVSSNEEQEYRFCSRQLSITDYKR
ncbi:MAG TPA: ATP-binding cassette domain-containing protein [Lacibacter sp.]|nr:ATP-binding cassette domain-containing protein [Lacibacter sp.]HMO87917.1 ATP-binding cassette domain-containing protein [Lacibacter sp.]HMP87745.1 ATP-binding cassette domain-containing protein [Lacibacter sp.]